MFSCERCIFFKNIYTTENMGMAANEVRRNIERPTDSANKKIVFGKTSIEEQMFGEKIFCGKLFCRLIRASDKNFWKAPL